MTPAARRIAAWERLQRDLPDTFFTQSATEITLSQAPEYASKIMDNQFHGRALVKIA